MLWKQPLYRINSWAKPCTQRGLTYLPDIDPPTDVAVSVYQRRCNRHSKFHFGYITIEVGTRGDGEGGGGVQAESFRIGIEIPDL